MIEGKLLSGTNILQIKKKKSVKHILKRLEIMRNIDANGQLTHNQTTSSNVF
jgi:hypothetical protein